MSNSKASKSLEFKINQIWLNLVPEFLIQILFWILKTPKSKIIPYTIINTYIFCLKKFEDQKTLGDRLNFESIWKKFE
jgi:hypothetical protein